MKQLLHIFTIIICVVVLFRSETISGNSDNIRNSLSSKLEMSISSTDNDASNAKYILPNGSSNQAPYHSPTLNYYVVNSGCTDSTAVNYDPLATIDDGSCVCNKNVTQALVGFDPSPIYSPMIWSYDTLSLTNTSSCDIRVRAEFDIFHDSLAIGGADFDLKWYNPYTSSWSFISYTIIANGHATGIWGVGGDTTGVIINQNSTQQVIIRFRFRPSANYGSYSALWETNEVDNLGNFIQNLDLDSTALDYVDCSNFAVDSSFISNITCFSNSNGNASIVSIDNGSGDYLFSWNNGETSNAITNLNSGDYYCIVTDMNWQQCNDSIGFSISEPNAITISIDSISNTSTYSGSDGFIYISSNGGSGSLTTTWSCNNGFSSNNEDIINIVAESYYLEITDINSCAYLDTIEITQPSSLWMNLDLATNTSCFNSCNGALNITANGGDSTYTYSWAGPNGFTSTNNDITNLCYGSYIITVNDGITNLTDTFNIYQPQPITSNLTIDSIICHNGSAQVEINVWGGTQPLIYNWSNGGNSYITAFSSGIHSINVTDQNGCSTSQTFSLTNPDSIIHTTNSTIIDCFGGNNGNVSISVLGGGIAPYSYLWSDGQTTNLANGLSAGIYSCLISDSNGCLDSAFAYVDEPSEIINTIFSTDASCYTNCDGSISAITSGGISPYNYIWNSGQTSQTATALCAGFYNVTITDANNCSIINSSIINEPNPILINVWINGTSLEATSSFSSYQWYTVNGTPITGATSPIFNPTSMGEYYVVVNDGNCEESSFIINYTISGLNDLHRSIKIFPNPTNGFITIESDKTIKSIVFRAHLGNQLLKVENNHNELSSIKIDLSTFAEGIYFIEIEQNNQIINYRIVLQ
jgi:hypothetical protein